MVDVVIFWITYILFKRDYQQPGVDVCMGKGAYDRTR